MPKGKTRVALYTDDLAPALRGRGYIAESEAEAGNLGVRDETQLSYATERDMVLFTYRVPLSTRNLIKASLQTSRSSSHLNPEPRTLNLGFFS